MSVCLIREVRGTIVLIIIKLLIKIKNEIF